QRPAAVFRFGELALGTHAARGHGEYLEPALALPRDVDRPAEPRLAPALRNGDGDLQPTCRECTQLAPVGGLDVGVGKDEDPHQMRSAKCGMRNLEAGFERPTTSPFNSAFRISHFALAVGGTGLEPVTSGM